MSGSNLGAAGFDVALPGAGPEPEARTPRRRRAGIVGVVAVAGVVVVGAAVHQRAARAEESTLTVSVSAAVCEPGNRACPNAVLPHIPVTIQQGRTSTTRQTDPEGEAHFASLDGGAVHVRVEVPGRTVEDDLTVSASGSTWAEVSLGPFLREASS